MVNLVFNRKTTIAVAKTLIFCLIHRRYQPFFLLQPPNVVDILFARPNFHFRCRFAWRFPGKVGMIMALGSSISCQKDWKFMEKKTPTDWMLANIIPQQIWVESRIGINNEAEEDEEGHNQQDGDVWDCPEID